MTRRSELLPLLDRTLEILQDIKEARYCSLEELKRALADVREGIKRTREEGSPGVELVLVEVEGYVRALEVEYGVSLH